MFPLILDTQRVRIVVVGRGPLAERRSTQIGVKVCESLTPEDIRTAHVVFVAGLSEEESEQIAAQCRAAGVLVNVEDVKHLCDFHTPALVQRGDLLLTISTNGKSPALAGILRGFLERLFPPVWGERLQRLADLRGSWREQGKTMAEIKTATQRIVKEEGWL